MTAKTSTRSFLDLRRNTGCKLTGEGRQAIAKFARKTEASKFARSCGWLASDVMQATTNIQAYWIVGQVFGDRVRAVNVDKSITEFDFPGFV